MAEEVKKNSPVANFLELLGKWDYNVPLTTQWTVTITPDAKTDIFNIISEYTRIDANSFFIPNILQQKLLNDKVQPKFDGVGLYFAQSVHLPPESFTTGGAGIDGMGGYLKGQVGNDRLEMTGRSLKIDFLETNLDFTSGLIRPWIIAASYKGLINLGDSNSIKCGIEVCEYTSSNTFEDKPLRKVHKFIGCVPTSINDKQLKYDSQEISINSVNWIYERYTYDLFSA